MWCNHQAPWIYNGSKNERVSYPLPPHEIRALGGAEIRHWLNLLKGALAAPSPCQGPSQALVPQQ